MPRTARSTPFPCPDLVGALRDLLAQITRGRVTTCGDLADALGNRIAARWVGHFALHHAHDAACPCHRVLRAGGQLGPYIAGSTAAKARMLADEGVAVRQGVVDLERFGVRSFASDRPLERLRKVQEAVQLRVSLRPRRRMPKLVGGVDVAYPSPGVGVAAYALVETATGRLAWSTTVRRPVTFPYISTYLSFREIPILLEMLEMVRAAGRMAEVLLVERKRYPAPPPRRHRLASGRDGGSAYRGSDQEAALRRGGRKGDGPRPSFVRCPPGRPFAAPVGRGRAAKIRDLPFSRR